MIKVDVRRKAFGDEEILRDVRFEMEVGETLAILGASGIGKSTLLRVILGLVAADVGEVVVDGLAVTPAARRPLVGRVGYVVQEGGLYPHLTAYGNVALPAQAQGWSRARIAERIDALAGLVRFDEAMLRAGSAEQLQLDWLQEFRRVLRPGGSRLPPKPPRPSPRR